MMERNSPQQRRMFRRIVPLGRFRPTATEISEARFRRFLRDLQHYERSIAFNQTVDSFLDLYSKWRKTQDDALKLRLVMLAFELHVLDQTFQCELSFT
jgi:hypothetical protein